MPRFVILHHDWPFDHFDFMLEGDGRLMTWRLPNAPTAGETVVAERLPDHRIDYLNYEGPVSGGRGTVRCWDRGIFSPPISLAGESSTHLTFNVYGERIKADVSVFQDSNQCMVMNFRPIKSG